MRILTGPQISTILRNLSPQDAQRLLDTLSGALATYTAQYTQGTAERHLHQPLRTVIQTSRGHTSLFMPVSDEGTTAIKVATVPKQGDIQGAITLYSDVGQLLGVLNAAEITAFRTALATMTVLTIWISAISDDALVNGAFQIPGGGAEHNVVVFGAGKQAEWHIRLILLLVPKVKRISIMSRSSTRLQHFVDTVVDPLRHTHAGIDFVGIDSGQPSYHVTMQDSLREASIICCCTPSMEPLFTLDDLQSNTNPSERFLSMIGSYKPEMQEIDTATLRQASQIVVDSKEACLEEAGELIRAKTIPEDLIEAGEFFTSHNRRKVEKSGLIVFKCVGLAVMDLTISQALLEMAADKQQGTMVDAF